MPVAKQGDGKSLDMEMQQLSISNTCTATTSSDFSLSRQPRLMKLTLLTLPQFNITMISRCLTVSERLRILACLHPRFRDFLFQPQCFPDMSFFPVSDDNMYSPKILSSNGCCGITYVEVNIFSKHPFISKVALLAGMWNFKADLWNRIDWPLNVNIESLQLTLDYTSSINTVHLDHRPQINFNLDRVQQEAQQNDHDNNNEEQEQQDGNESDERDSHEMQIDDTDKMAPMLRAATRREIEIARKRGIPRALMSVTPVNELQEVKSDEVSNTSASTESSESTATDCYIANRRTEYLSPTTRKPIPMKCRLRNLFFIRFDSSSHQPKIQFPKTLWGLGLQSFNANLFAQSWWIQQIQMEQRLENLRFLVLSCCEFQENQLQLLLDSTPNIEHLSLRYVRWEGTVIYPKSLLSLGYFPDRQFEAFYDLRNCDKLWQISTRFNERPEESHKFVNTCRELLSIHRVKFEYIRREQYAERDIDFRNLHKWEYQCSHNQGFTVAIDEQDLNHYPLLKEIFTIPDDMFLSLDDVKFEDCPLWSEESQDFIHMTNKRKLLLR